MTFSFNARVSCVLGDFVNARTRENQSKGANSREGSRGTLPKKLPEAATMDNDVDFCRRHHYDACMDWQIHQAHFSLSPFVKELVLFFENVKGKG